MTWRSPRATRSRARRGSHDARCSFALRCDVRSLELELPYVFVYLYVSPVTVLILICNISILMQLIDLTK